MDIPTCHARTVVFVVDIRTTDHLSLE